MESRTIEQTSPRTTERQPWSRPEIRRTLAGNSEITLSNVNTDGVIYS